jgi:hypothetical protein
MSVIGTLVPKKYLDFFILTVHYIQIYEPLPPLVRGTFGKNWFTYIQTIIGPQLSDELLKHTRLYNVKF